MTKNKVSTFLLDVDRVNEDTEDIFQGLYYSIKHFYNSVDDNLNNGFKFRDQCTDSRRGGILFALANNIKMYNLQYAHYLISLCTLNNLQTALKNAVVNVSDNGRMVEGEHKMIMMQMIHGCYNIQKIPGNK